MDLKEVKVCLRALISANPMSYHVNTLMNDFRGTTGFNLPLFGHLNPVEFLRSINDTVQLKGDPWNPEVALVESEKSAHIISLVSRQRVNERLMLKNHYDVNSHRRHVVPIKKTENYNKSDGNYSRYQQHFYKTAKEPDKRPIFLMPEMNFYSCAPSQPKTSIPTTAIKSQSVYSNIQNTVLNKEITIVPEKEDKELWKKVSLESVDRIKTDNCYFEDVSDDDSCQSFENSRGNSCPDSSAPSELVNSGIKNKLQKLIKNYPEGLWCCELPNLFYEKFNFVLDYREYGYTSLIQMLSELPDVFRCIRPGNEDWILFDASAPPSEREKRIVNFHLKGDVLCNIKANIQKLLSESCGNAPFDGVELDKISELYQKTFGSSLECSSLGFKDVKSLLEIWEGSVLNLVNVRGKLVCCPARTVHSPIRWEEALPPITAENDIFAEIFPKEVSGPEEDFPHLDLTRHIAAGHVVEVCVAEVWSPSKFFLQLNKYKTRLNQFMDELQKFYNVHLNKYKMPESTLRPNQICVGLYNADPEYPDEWHRAQIIRVINEKTVLINFVDYGTVTRVKKSHLRFLHRRFRAFPVQAIQAQLSGVAPPNDEAMWPMTTSKKFLELLRVPYLNAEIVEIDFKIPVLSVILYDPFQKSNLNKKLVWDKLARAGESLYFQEEVSETKIPENEMKGLSECSSSELVQANESFSKNVPEISDQFLDVDDLNDSDLFKFKMGSLKTASSLSENKKEVLKKTESLDISYEFEEIPELKENGEESKPEVEATKQNPPDNAKVPDVVSEPAPPPPEMEELQTPAPPEVSEEKPKPEISHVDTAPAAQSLPRKSKRLPPGLEHVNTVSDFAQIPFLLQPQDLRKEINLLAMELLTQNDSIKQVGVNDPVLALKIATEMAEAYLSPELSMRLPMRYNLYPLFTQPALGDVAPSALLPVDLPPTSSLEGQDLGVPPEVPAPFRDSEPTGTPVESSDSTREISPEESAPQPSPPKQTAESKKYVEEAQIGGKTLRLIKVDDQAYFSAEELVRLFTSFSNREIADRLLHTKKMKADYRIISKKSDEKVLQALKSSSDLLGVVKRKSKQLKVYLLPVGKVMPFLQALGCRTESFKNDIEELLKRWEEKKTQKTKVSC